VGFFRHDLGGALPRHVHLSLVAACILWFALGGWSIRNMGIVGEVSQSWVSAAPARVLVEVPQVAWADGTSQPTAGSQLGPLVASQARPIERLEIGPLRLPLAVNIYTGGLPDWPARLVYSVTGSHRAVVAMNLALGAALIWLVHRFLLVHASPGAAGAAALLLASDWAFLFYKKALGGTEIALQAAQVLCLWGLWSRRWGGGRHGPWLLALGLGLGLSAKVTFLMTAVALVVAAALTRWDRPAMRPPLPRQLWRPALLLGLLLLPLLVTLLHHQLIVPTAPHVRSHDFPSVQLERVVGAFSGGPGPVREGLVNLELWLLSPLKFFERSYSAVGAPGWSAGRLAGWLLVALGVALGWRDRHPTPHQALLRFTSLALTLQIGLLWGVARDLHHLAQAAPLVAIVGALAFERLAAHAAPPRSIPRARLLLALCLPFAVSGARLSLATDRVLGTIPVTTFTQTGQAALVDLLRAHKVIDLVACDYELTGVLEALAPDIEVTHGWGAASWQGGDVLPALLEQAVGGHLVVMKASAPMVYNVAPRARALEKAAAQVGLRVDKVGALSGDSAVLYRVERLATERPVTGSTPPPP
jgi:hypothetical protein